MLLTLTRSASAWALCAMISIKQRSADALCPSSMAAGKNKKKRRLRILDADSGKKKRRIGVSSGIGNHGGNESVLGGDGCAPPPVQNRNYYCGEKHENKKN